MLGPEGTGSSHFSGAITGFTVLFFPVWLFQCRPESCLRSVRMTLKAGNSPVHQLFSHLLSVFFIRCFIFFISFYVDTWFHVEIGWILRWASFMLVALPMTLLIPQIGRGMNAIHRLSIFNILQPLLYLGGAFLLLFSVKIEPVHLILLNMITTVIAIFVVIYTFHPLFLIFAKQSGLFTKKRRSMASNSILGRSQTRALRS